MNLQVRLQSFFADGLVRQAEPELAGLEADSFVRVLGPLQHVVDDVVHVGDQPVHPDLQQHHDGPADVLADFWVLVRGQEEQALDELVNVEHQCL